MGLLDMLFERDIESSLQSHTSHPFCILFRKDIARRVPWVRLPDPDASLILPEGIGTLAVYIGSTEVMKRPVFWMPMEAMNPHMLVVGSTGAGKSTFVKTVVVRMGKEGVRNILIIDFTGEYDEFISGYLRGRVIKLGKEDYINVLDLASTHPRQRIDQNIEALISALELQGAPRQKRFLRKVLERAYREKGIPLDEKTTDPNYWRRYNKQSPTLMDAYRYAVELLESEGEEGSELDSQAKSSVLGLVEKLEKFTSPPYDAISKPSTVPLEELIINPGITCLDLSGFPTNEMKMSIALLFLYLLETFMRTFPVNTGKVLLFLVIDEGWKLLLLEDSPLNTLAREARKYGVALMFSTQRPTDAHPSVFGQMGTVVALALREEKEREYLAKSLGLPERLVKRIEKAKRGEAVMVIQYAEKNKVEFGINVDPVLLEDDLEIVFKAPSVDWDKLVKEISSVY
jgi:DNA helicase HerA-like ATPase